MSSGNGPGRRETSDWQAKLERHVERLPDYAQRVQHKLQRYLPPDEHRSGKPEQPTRGGRWPDLPTVAEVRSRWARWHDPAAKLERRKRWTSHALTLWAVLAVVCAVVAVLAFPGVLAAQARVGSLVGGIAGVLAFGTLSVRTGLRLRALNRTKLDTSAEPPPLPATSSAAREPMERLAESEAALTGLLRQLSAPTKADGPAVPAMSVEEARTTARDAAAALRDLAARIQALERAMDSLPTEQCAELAEAVRGLRAQADDGLDGYGELVASAGRAVAASSAGPEPSRQALADATDRLAGLASALRELAS